MPEVLSNNSADAYAPIRAETSSTNTQGLRYFISDIPINWDISETDDFYVVAISSDGQIVERLSNTYLSFDSTNNALTVSPVFGEKDFCVYVFRDENAANLFDIKPDGNASLVSILSQFEKDNRVLRQLQASQTRTLRTPDTCTTISESYFRSGKVLTFDSNGNPETNLDAQDYRDVKSYRDEANDARLEANRIKDETQTLKDETQSLKDETQTLKDETQTLKNGTQAIKDSAQVILDNAVEITDPEMWRRNTNAAIEAEREKFIPFQSVADLKTSTILKAGSFATTLGYYSANDGGGADYIVVEDSSLVDDGGAVLKVGNGNLRAKQIINNSRVNVRSFGAKSDYDNGDTDNSTFFANAISYIREQGDGLILYCPVGKYAIADTLLLDGVKCDIEFDGDIYYITSDTNRNRPAIKIKNTTNRTYKLSGVFASGEGLPNWNASNDFIGVHLCSINFCHIAISRVTNFAMGVRCDGVYIGANNVNSYAYNELYVDTIDNNRIGLYVYSNLSSWTNANRFGGTIVRATIPTGFTGRFYGIVCDADDGANQMNANEFYNFDITGDSGNSSSSKISILCRRCSATFRRLRWESGVESEYNKSIVIDCECSPLPTNFTGHPKGILFIDNIYINGGTISYINTNRTFCSLYDIAHVYGTELKSAISYVPSENVLPVKPQSGLYSKQFIIWKGLPNDDARSLTTLDACCKGISDGVLEVGQIFDGTVFPNFLWANPVFLFKVKKGTNIAIDGCGRKFRASAKIFDSTGAKLYGNGKFTADAMLDGVKYGDFVSSFFGYNGTSTSYYNIGKGNITLSDNSVVPVKYSGLTYSNSNEIRNGTWTTIGETPISGTFANGVVNGRVSAYFNQIQPSGILDDGSSVSRCSFSVLDDETAYISITIATPSTDPFHKIEMFTDTGIFCRYPPKWKHLRGFENRYYSIEKPTSKPYTDPSNTEHRFLIENGQRVYDASLDNFGKYWEYNASTQLWSDLQ